MTKMCMYSRALKLKSLSCFNFLTLILYSLYDLHLLKIQIAQSTIMD